MSVKYGVFGIILSFFILFLAIKSYEAWTHSVEVVPDKETMKKSEAKVNTPPVTPAAQEPSATKPDISIAEKNIFNPERKDFPIVAPGSVTSMKPMARPQIILYGITLTKDYQSVSIVQPGRPLRKGERELMTLKVGERIGEYKVTKIFPDRITLEAEGDMFEVSLYDLGKPKQRTYVKTETKPASVTTAVPTPATPSAVPSKPRQEPVQKPQEPVPGRMATSPSLPSPASPSFPPSSTVRGRRLHSPRSESSTTPGGPVTPRAPKQGTEE